MISDEIYIERTTMEEIINAYKTQIECFVKSSNCIINEINKLESGWDGIAKKTFFEDAFPSYKSYMEETVELLYLIADNLEYIYNVFYGTNTLTNRLKKVESVSDSL